MKSVAIKFALLFSFFSWGTGEVYAEVRNALVIGNGDYKQVGALENPPNDAKLMAETLRGLDFNVIEVIDASQLQMKRAVRDFGAKLNEAGRDGVGLFYYAGHGVQVNGANYIIPVDAVIDSEGDVDIESVNANSILSMMEYSNARLSFVVLDACRNNPYSRGFRSATRGLAKMSAPTGSFVAYATSPGDVAVDGKGQNSPYTASLAKHMSEPGVPIEKVFRNVRNEVRSATSNQQTPWESSSLIGDDYYFKTVVEIETTSQGQEVTVSTTGNDGQTSTVTSANANTNTGVATVAQPVVVNTGKDRNIELLFWDSVKDSQNPAVVNAYVNKYPDGIFVELAQLKIAALGGSTPEKPVATAQPQTVVVAKPEPEPEVIAKPINLAAVTPNPARAKLDECEGHFRANRLTSGQGGNALTCYQQVMRIEPGHPDALAGIVKIENKYARWASLALDRNNLQKAEKNIAKLRAMNEEHQQLAALDERFALSLSAKQAAQQAAQAPKQKPVAQKVASVEKPKAVKKSKVTEAQRCAAYLDAGVLHGSGADNAWGCYGAMLKENPNDPSAKDGRANVELAMYKQFREHINSKSLRAAEKTMRQMRKMNKRSKHYKKMRPLYEELKMESRW
ncbi:MAG: caspase family protein [Acidiferrobacterales bacterium]|nr:caspase family protein [Acidiferrobacterales bacterium]